MCENKEKFFRDTKDFLSWWDAECTKKYLKGRLNKTVYGMLQSGVEFLLHRDEPKNDAHCEKSKTEEAITKNDIEGFVKDLREMVLLGAKADGSQLYRNIEHLCTVLDTDIFLLSDALRGCSEAAEEILKNTGCLNETVEEEETPVDPEEKDTSVVYEDDDIIVRVFKN